jgi:hypothetical protein
MLGIVIETLVATKTDAPVQAKEFLELEQGQGIVGDRNFLLQQSLDMSLRRKEDLTLISSEELETFNSRFECDIPFGNFRRNIITRDIDLNALVGKRFRIGTALCEGIELCEPCSKLARTVHRMVLPHLVHRAGLRAAIIESGRVAPGDTIEELTLR